MRIRPTRRIRPAIALPAVTVLLVASGASAAVAASPTNAVPTCRPAAVKVTAKPSGTAHVVRISVTNDSGRACAVDRIPTVTFGNLDGAALPVPLVDSAPYRLPAGRSAYAVVRTLDPAATEHRTVKSLAVAAHPSHYGTRFGAARVGAPKGITVWEPVTTLWQSSRAEADAALADAG